MKIKFFKREKHFKKDNFWSRINLLWISSVCVMLTMIVFSLLFGAYLFLEVNKKLEISHEGGSGQVETVDKERINTILEYFDQKREKSKEILYSSPFVADPSR